MADGRPTLAADQAGRAGDSARAGDGRPAPPADDRRPSLRPVRCARCGAAPLVAKFSPQHTSVQWTAAATARCAEFGARTAAGARGALIEGCGALRDSIDAAVASGRLAVAPPSYE